MGCTPSKRGVHVLFLKEDGSLDESRPGIFAKSVEFYSTKRPQQPASDNPIYGSKCWLTHVLVADDEDKLSQLKKAAGDPQHCATSCCSKHVNVDFDVNGDNGKPYKDSLQKQITIALGTKPIDSAPYTVHTLKVLPASTQMNPNHPLWPEWQTHSAFMPRMRATGTDE